MAAFKYILVALIAFSIYHFYPCLFGCHKKSHDLESFKRDGWFGLKKLSGRLFLTKTKTNLIRFFFNL